MSKQLPILMFCALPASGKSESRRYLKSLNKEQNAAFHLGDTSTQVDDYPYVDAMRKIDAAAEATMNTTVFFDPATTMFKSGFDWGTLMYLINDDYFDIKKCDSKIPAEYQADPCMWLFNRYDAAFVKTGKIPARFAELKASHTAEQFNAFKAATYELCNTILKEKYENIPASLEGKTVVFEFARGGKQGSKFPLEAPYGYQYSLGLLDPEILENACILYIWVTPEQSYQKNINRAQEGAQGLSQTVSTQLSLNHGVPHNVMVNEYGTDDVDYLLSVTEKKDCLTIHRDGKAYFVKIGRFDNREDKTTPFRKPQAQWKPEEVESMKAGMIAALDAMLK
ncbi:Conserved_hypothetical protein [Hexamita inflata]|uniref:Uncharacterized protein n=1 Tax=Hexamita inflata TaxID=28002 RepID=A0AA86RAA0_9EUKA|nr:Conserved hypothetical protein [Hexamita inflata]